MQIEGAVGICRTCFNPIWDEQDWREVSGVKHHKGCVELKGVDGDPGKAAGESCVNRTMLVVDQDNFLFEIGRGFTEFYLKIGAELVWEGKTLDSVCAQFLKWFDEGKEE